MARPIWNGAISFGLVSIPVKLFSATVDRAVRFHQIDSKTGSRVRQKRVSEASGEEVAYEDIVKGYELSSGRYVTIDDDELSSVDPKASRTIDLVEFVDLESIDPIFYNAAYYLAPDPAAAKPYALLLNAMLDAGKVGIAKFVMRGKEYLCAIRADDEKLVLSTMRYADEIRGAEEIEQLEAVREVELTDKEVAMAGQLIESLDAEFDPERFHDTYREKIMELVTAKGEGEEPPAAPEEPSEHKVIDLMAALEASVADAKAARRRHPTGQDDEAGEEGEADGEPAEKPAAKKAAAKKSAPKKAAAKKSTKKAATKKAPAKRAATRKSA